MFVLDTNVISELRYGKPNQSPEVRAWAGAQPASMLYLSAITTLELKMGIQALERRSPPQGSTLRIWLTGVRVTAYPRSTLRARRNDCRNRDRASVHRCDSQHGGLCQYRRGACQFVAGVSRGTRNGIKAVVQ